MSSRVARPRTLRGAILAPISWRVPPRRYGPWEQFASLLTEGLVRRGVDVTLFATADSVTTADLVGTAPTGYSEDPALDAKAWEALHISAVFEHAGEFEVIHNSFDFLPLTYSGLVETPVVTTIHGVSSEQIVPVFEKYNRIASCASWLCRTHRRAPIFVDFNHVASGVCAAREAFKTFRAARDDRVGVGAGLDHVPLVDLLVKEVVE
jgi:hypothetical protein